MSEFHASKLTQNTWHITTPGCDCCLLEGDNEAFTIDSGISGYPRLCTESD